MHSAGPWRVRRLHGGCVRSLCRNPDQKRPVVCFDESPIPTHRRACADRPRPTPVSSSTTIASTSATAPSVCSYSSTRAPALGARSTSPTAAPRSASPPVCATLADGRFSKAERIRAVLDPLRRRALPSPAAGRSAPPPVLAPVPLRPQACQLAEHGRDRDWRAAQPMPRTADPMHTTHPVRGGGLGATTQCLASPWMFTTESSRQSTALTPASLRPKRHNHRAENQSLSPPPLVCTH